MVHNMAASYKVPPKFDEARPHKCWKNESNVWAWVTKREKGLEGRAREPATEIPAEDLDSDRGLTTLITKLDAVFLKEEKDCSYEAYSFFDALKSSSVSMADYIINFEQRYNRKKKYNITLRDSSF